MTSEPERHQREGEHKHVSQPADRFVRRVDRAAPPGSECGLAGACVQNMVLSERIRALHGELATIRARLDRLDAVLSRGMAVLLANLTGVVLMLARQFLLK